MSCTYLFITNPYGLVIFSVCYLCLDKTSMFTVRFSINKAEITSGGKFLGDRINNLTKGIFEHCRGYIPLCPACLSLGQPILTNSMYLGVEN